jgi:phosphoglucomutase
MKVNSLAGKLPPKSMLIDVADLINAYYTGIPDASIPEQLVEFGTSGHRGSSKTKSFNEMHILAISQAICLYRSSQGIDGPLYLGFDTHALSLPAMKSALEVLTANDVVVMLAEGDEYTPTPVISHAILKHNRGRNVGFADGIVITPSHNPPDEGGFKYNPPTGGPADQNVTNWIQNKANEFLKNGMKGVRRLTLEKALASSNTRRHNYLKSYVDDLANVVDMNIIANSGIHLGVDPLGGAGIHYWKAIADTYKLQLTIVNEVIDPTFSFMTVDWDGKIRMDPSSPYAMQGLISLKEKFDIAFACDTDYDRHGIVTKSSGLLPPNHYISAAIFYLFQHRPNWSKNAKVGKTLVSSQMIDRVAKKLGRKVDEVPVGFKWFVNGLLDGSLGFVGEESAGGTFLRTDNTVWTTDKDGIIMALLSGEMTARMGKDPGQIYADLTDEFGNSFYERLDAPANAKQKSILKNLTPESIHFTQLAGEDILSIITKAPGNDAPIGGIKVTAPTGWFAARPSGTEDIYKIYGESFIGQDHLEQIIVEAQIMVDTALKDV